MICCLNFTLAFFSPHPKPHHKSYPPQSSLYSWDIYTVVYFCCLGSAKLYGFHLYSFLISQPLQSFKHSCGSPVNSLQLVPSTLVMRCLQLTAAFQELPSPSEQDELTLLCPMTQYFLVGNPPSHRKLVYCHTRLNPNPYLPDLSTGACRTRQSPEDKWHMSCSIFLTGGECE